MVKAFTICPAFTSWMTQPRQLVIFLRLELLQTDRPIGAGGDASRASLRTMRASDSVGRKGMPCLRRERQIFVVDVVQCTSSTQFSGFDPPFCGYVFRGEGFWCEAARSGPRVVRLG